MARVGRDRGAAGAGSHGRDGRVLGTGVSIRRGGRCLGESSGWRLIPRASRGCAWFGAVTLVCCVPLAVAVPASGAFAGARGFGMASSLSANAASDLELYSVSCVSVGDCSAVGVYGASSGSQGVLLTESSGTWAPGVEATMPANAEASDPLVDLASVSCASPGDCSAVGGYTDSSENMPGVLLTERSGTWAPGVQAILPTNAAENPSVDLESVSCASPGGCTAVGRYSDKAGNEQGLVLTERSGTWAPGVEASLPANAASDQFVDLDSVSCASVGNCVAVGTYTDSSGNTQGLLLTETSGTWARGVQASLPPNAGKAAELESVSCASPGDCSAVGSYTDTAGHEQGLLLTERSGTWAPGGEAILPANAAAAPPQVAHVLFSVSCASAGNCGAVGAYIDGSGNTQDVLLTETSGTWAPGVEATLPANAAATPSGDMVPVLDSVSCASAGNCGAVGAYIDGSGNAQGVLFTETSGTWAPGVEASPPANAQQNPSVSIFSVACASPGDCSAVGDYSESGGPAGLLLTESTGTWAPGVEASPPSNAFRGETGPPTIQLLVAPTSTGQGASVELWCAAPTAERCQTSEMLTTTETLNGHRPIAVSAVHTPKKGVRAVVVVGGVNVAIAGNSAETITIPLNVRGRRLLKDFHALPVTLTVKLIVNGLSKIAVNHKLIIGQPAPRSVIRTLVRHLVGRDGGASVSCFRAAARRYDCTWLVGGTGPGAYRTSRGGTAEVIARGRKLLVRHVVITCAPDGRHDVCPSAPAPDVTSSLRNAGQKHPPPSPSRRPHGSA
jgi:hypothetical protein